MSSKPTTSRREPQPASRGLRREGAGPPYPYQITCTGCDVRLVAVERDWLVLVGPRPIEIVTGLDGDTHIVCSRCGTMVPIDRDLLLPR